MIGHQVALIKREIWEHRSIWITPAAVAFVLTFLAIAMLIRAAAFGEAFNPEIEKIADATIPLLPATPPPPPPPHVMLPYH